MRFKELDDYCKEIFATLAVKGKMRYNKLYEIHKTEMAKPTLSMHLKHLVNEKFVIRKVEDVLNVSYEVNYRKMGNEKSYKQSYDEVGKLLERGVENFVSLPVNKQVENVCMAMLMKSLYELKARIDFAVNPDSWEKELLFSLWTDPEESLPNLEKWLIRLCVEDKKYRQEVLEKLTKELEIAKDAVP